MPMLPEIRKAYLAALQALRNAGQEAKPLYHWSKDPEAVVSNPRLGLSDRPELVGGSEPWKPEALYASDSLRANTESMFGEPGGLDVLKRLLTMGHNIEGVEDKIPGGYVRIVPKPGIDVAPITEETLIKKYDLGVDPNNIKRGSDLLQIRNTDGQPGLTEYLIRNPKAVNIFSDKKAWLPALTAAMFGVGASEAEAAPISAAKQAYLEAMHALKKIKVTHISSNTDTLANGFEDRLYKGYGTSFARKASEELSAPTLSEVPGPAGRVHATISGKSLDYNKPEHRKIIEGIEAQQEREIQAGTRKQFNIVQVLRDQGYDYVNNWTSIGRGRELHALNPKAINIDRIEPLDRDSRGRILKAVLMGTTALGASDADAMRIPGIPIPKRSATDILTKYFRTPDAAGSKPLEYLIDGAEGLKPKVDDIDSYVKSIVTDALKDSPEAPVTSLIKSAQFNRIPMDVMKAATKRTSALTDLDRYVSPDAWQEIKKFAGIPAVAGMVGLGNASDADAFPLGKLTQVTPRIAGKMMTKMVRSEDAFNSLVGHEFTNVTFPGRKHPSDYEVVDVLKHPKNDWRFVQMEDAEGNLFQLPMTKDYLHTLLGAKGMKEYSEVFKDLGAAGKDYQATKSVSIREAKRVNTSDVTNGKLHAYEASQADKVNEIDPKLLHDYLWARTPGSEKLDLMVPKDYATHLLKRGYDIQPRSQAYNPTNPELKRRTTNPIIPPRKGRPKS